MRGTAIERERDISVSLSIFVVLCLAVYGKTTSSGRLGMSFLVSFCILKKSNNTIYLMRIPHFSLLFFF